jgi:CBS domain-containing protein
MTTDTLISPTSAIDPLEAGVAVQQRGIPRLPTAAQVMSRHPAVVDAHTSLFSAWGQLHGEQHRHLVVIDEDVRPIGVLDERDIALEWPPGPLGAHHLPVYKLLRFRTRPRVRAEDDIVTVARTMLSSREDALPIVDEDGRLLGLVTVWQLLELIAAIRGRDQAPTHSAAPAPGYDRTAH